MSWRGSWRGLKEGRVRNTNFKTNNIDTSEIKGGGEGGWEEEGKDVPSLLETFFFCILSDTRT